MMASNLFSRILTSNPQIRSIYEDLRAHDEASDSDLEEQAGMALDEENLGFHDEELGHADVFNGEDSRLTTESTAFLGRQRGRAVPSGDKGKKRDRWFTQSPRLIEDDGDDDVPQSLLVEDHGNPIQGIQSNPLSPKSSRPPNQAIPNPRSNRETRAHWEAAQAQQRLHRDDGPEVNFGQGIPQQRTMLSSNPREKAMWMWLNVVNLDGFIRQVYDYYTGSGIW